MRVRYSGASLLAIAVALACAPTGAAQQSAASATKAVEDTLVLEEVVVTATRRTEKLQSVPIAVTAITGDALATQQQVDVTSLARTVPNLNIAPFPGDNSNATISLRGQVSIDNTPNVDPAVGLYLDGVYLARSSGGNLSLIDIERVEVLRGPQGTLFGRNTIGGALNIIPKRPTQHLEGSVEASYGNYNAWKLVGVVNVPVSEQVAVRFAGSHTERDGFAHSRLTGNQLNADNTDYIRGSVSLALTEGWDVLLTGDYTSFTNEGQWTTLASLAPAGSGFIGLISQGKDNGAAYVAPFTKHPDTTTTGPYSSKTYGGSATVTGELGDWATLKSITAYREAKRDNRNNDLDGTPYVFLQQLNDDMKQSQFSQELQLFGTALDDRLDWITGGYYFRENSDLITRSRFVFGRPGATPVENVTDGRDIINSSASLFAQLSYKITPEFALTAGARHVWDARDITLRNRTQLAATGTAIVCGNSAASLPDCRVDVKKATFDYTPFTVGLNYTPASDRLFYVKWSRGFRSGGFNTRATNSMALSPFNPERVDSYEGGVKLDFGRSFRFNAAAYHSKFTDIQFVANIPVNVGGVVNTAAIVQNAGSARVNGLETEATLLLGNLRLNGSLGLIDAKYTSILPTVVAVTKDSPFQQTPDLTWSLSADYDIPVSFGNIHLHGDYSYKDEVAYSAVPPSDPANLLPSYALINAMATVSLDQSGLELSVWGRNLANKKYLSRTLDLGALGVVSGFPGDPRTYGVTARYRF